MTRTAWPTVSAGQVWTAANFNTYCRDNDLAYWKYTTAGDLVYADASNSLARVGVGASGTLLASDGTKPYWMSVSSVNYRLEKFASTSWSNTYSVGDVNKAKLTNGTVNVALTDAQQYLVLVRAQVRARHEVGVPGSGDRPCSIWATINGTNWTNVNDLDNGYRCTASSSIFEGERVLFYLWPYLGSTTGATTLNVQLYGRGANDGTNYYDGGCLSVTVLRSA